MEEKIKALEKEKAMLLEEIAQLKEVAVLNEKAKNLEEEVNMLKIQIRELRSKIPPKLLEELMEVASGMLEGESKEETLNECYSCQQEEESI